MAWSINWSKNDLKVSLSKTLKKKTFLAVWYRLTSTDGTGGFEKEMVSLVASLETALKVMPEGKERKIALKTLPGIQGGKERTPLPATEI